MSSERSSIDVNQLIAILEIPCELRRPEDIQLIVRFSTLFKFFYEIVESQSSTDTIVQISKFLQVKTFEPGQFVFKSQDPSDYFYFILKGCVKISSNIYVDIEEPGDEELHKVIRHHLEGSTPRGKKTKNAVPEVEIIKLHTTETFGEMALINDKPRYFTAQCEKPTILAALHRNDYYKIDGTQEKIVTEKMDFLRSIDAFKSWSKIALYKLSSFFKEVKFLRGATVYTEGDPANSIYLIKKGDFKFTQKFSINAGSKSLVDSKDARDTTVLKNLKNNTIRSKELQIVTKQAGEIFGFEEIHEGIPKRQFTCKCLSQIGKLFWISEKNFTKRVTHPESLKIIEEQCKTFKSWVSPRLERLKELELYKDDTSYTAYQKIKINSRTSTASVSNRVRNYSEFQNESFMPLPVILKNTLTSRGTAGSGIINRSTRKGHKKSNDFRMFTTEVKDDFPDLNPLNRTSKIFFKPTKLDRSKIKKEKTSLF